jgi:hypothetical protein
MKIHVKNVNAHVTGFRDTHQCVQVRTVEINQASLLMDDCSDSVDVLFEKPQGVRIGNHYGGDILVHHFCNRRRVEYASRCRRNLNDVVATQSRARGVSPVGCVRDNNLLTGISFLG